MAENSHKPGALGTLLYAQVQDAVDASYQAGYGDGYRAVLGRLEAFLREGREFLGDHFEDEQDAPEPEPTPSAEPAAVTSPVVAGDAEPRLPPYLQAAYARLQSSPGMTSRRARAEWGGSSSVLYRLAARGLAEKRGAQFYAR